MADREYTIDYSNPVEAARATINMHIDTLVSFRGNPVDADELEWEIRLYEYMLGDPEVRLNAYYGARYDHDDMIVRSKRDVAKHLGWDVK